jgi:hypothetical protein
MLVYRGGVRRLRNQCYGVHLYILVVSRNSIAILPNALCIIGGTELISRNAGLLLTLPRVKLRMPSIALLELRTECWIAE